MVVFAHSGHWLASLMYLLPVVVCMLFLLAAKIKDRGRNASVGPSDVGLREQPERE